MSAPHIPYEQFLQNKIRLAKVDGFTVNDEDINPALKPHNKIMVKWMVSGGQRACFAAFGLHKSVTQLETIRCTLLHTGGRGLIIAPLNVIREFQQDAVNILKWETAPKFIRRVEEAESTGIYLTNYETVRDGKLDPRLFNAVSLDEASILRGFGGTKTFREFMRIFTGDAGPNRQNRRGNAYVKYRFVATATPSPNDYIELLAYADFLGVMDISQAKTRFFKRNSTQADKLVLLESKEEEFWLWVASWALFVTKPSDLTGNPADDEGYLMPPLDLRWHEIPTDHSKATAEKNGQGRLFKESALNLHDAAREKKDSLPLRIAKMMELRSENITAHRIIWHDLEAERVAIEKAIPEISTVYGAMDMDEREEIIYGFSNGTIQELGAKPVMLGSGCNLQRHCSWAIYLGIGFKFNDFIQSIHRILRFLQQNQVRVDLIYTEAERQVRKALERKWQQHNKMVEKMTQIIRQFGLSQTSMAQLLNRKMGVERVEVKGKNFTCINNDSVKELAAMAENSVHLVLSSIPFSMQYEYSPNYADLGHNDNNAAFFEQMDYMTPNVYKVCMPGRLAIIHVKDRVVPAGMTGLGFQTVYPFHLHTIMHYTKHGFEYVGMKTIVTDVVRENNQTYRLGWTEQCKDGTKMGVGMPEYLLYFRKPVTDTSKSYADIPVVKLKKFYDDVRMQWDNPAGYSRARWQIDAHGFERSNGNRLLTPEEYTKLEPNQVFKVFKDYTLNNVYDFEYHVAIGEALEAAGKLPSGFMLLQPQSWSDEVWADVTRMLTLNGSQWSKGKEMHICPMQFDIADRVIKQLTNPGEIVLDMFGGLMTVPYRAVIKGRKGIGIELNPGYFFDGVAYCKAAEEKKDMPTLFDLVPETETAA